MSYATMATTGSERCQLVSIMGVNALLHDPHRIVFAGGAKGTRTPDPLLAKQVLFQLSYSPESRRSKGTCGPARWRTRRTRRQEWMAAPQAHWMQQQKGRLRGPQTPCLQLCSCREAGPG